MPNSAFSGEGRRRRGELSILFAKNGVRPSCGLLTESMLKPNKVCTAKSKQNNNNNKTKRHHHHQQQRQLRFAENRHAMKQLDTLTGGAGRQRGRELELENVILQGLWFRLSQKPV